MLGKFFLKKGIASPGLTWLPQRSFARTLAQKMTYKERKVFQSESQPEETKNTKQEERMDPKSKDIDDYYMAKARLSVQHLPERMLKRCAQVFNKFQAEDIRGLGKKYMRLYQLIHANEKPSDLTLEREPYCNTDEMGKEENAIIYLGKKRLDATEGFEQKKKWKAKKSKMEEKIKGEEELENMDLNDIAKEDPAKKDFNIVYDKNMVLAYLLRKMPHTYGTASRVISEIKFRLPDYQPKTMLDFGAGLGSGVCAFHDIYPDAKRIVAVEPATGMRKLGKHLTQDINHLVWMETLARLINISDVDGGFDLVHCAYVLEEVQTAENRERIVETLWQKVNPNGIMIIMEPGSPKGFRFIHDIRKWIISKSRDEANIIAPCPHHQECPLAQPHHMWCNFEQDIAKYPKSVFPKLTKERTIDLEKFMFLVVKKGPIIKSREEAKTPAERSFFWGRLIRPSLIRGGHIIMDLCSPKGELQRVIVSKSHGEEGGYKFAKDVRWGDFWPLPDRIPNKFRRENNRGRRLW
jgi:ribosomal protein RSM22 (predicted rRNA methylase)